MSLLMDALRKAEQEKKAAAKKLREQQLQDTGENADSGNHLSLQATETADRENIESAGRETEADSEEPERGSEADTLASEWRRPATELDLSLVELSQPLSATDDSTDSDDFQNEAWQADSASIEPSGVDHHSRVDIDLSQPASGRQPAFIDRDRTLAFNSEAGDRTQSDNEAEPAVEYTPPDSYADPESGERLADHSAEEATRERPESRRSNRNPIPGRQSDSVSLDRIDTPATAQQVFAARKPASPATLTILVLVGLILVGLTASGVFYYYSVTPSVRGPSSARIAEDIESRQSAAEKIALSETDSSATALTSQSQPAVEMLPDMRGTGNESVTAGTDQEPAAEYVEEAVVQARPDAATDATDATVKNVEENNERMAASDDDQADIEENAAAHAEELELKPALLKISRSQSSTDINKAVQDAYAAYTRGELSLSKELYQAALRNNPEDRNVLLGLAAIAVKEQRFDAAYRYYADILRQNPSDRVAGTAIISMQQQGDPAARESRLRRMLEETPDAAYLHQALGQVYAQTQRWAQAQQAYFDAYSLDEDNADYAYNLAVSLDRLGQPQAARDYYIEALELAAVKSGSFARQSAEERINQIEQASQSSETP